MQFNKDIRKGTPITKYEGLRHDLPQARLSLTLHESLPLVLYIHNYMEPADIGKHSEHSK